MKFDCAYHYWNSSEIYFSCKQAVFRKGLGFPYAKDLLRMFHDSIINFAAKVLTVHSF
jgi:hypothetical protein